MAEHVSTTDLGGLGLTDGQMWAILGVGQDGETSLILSPNTNYSIGVARVYTPIVSKDRAKVEATLRQMLSTPDGKATQPFLAEFTWKRVAG